MAEEWHYAHDGKQLGPVSSEELRRLAASGQLQPTDLIWKNGMANWAPASRLKGLFPQATSTKPGPPPLDPATTRSPVPPPIESAETQSPTLGEALKAAGGLAAEQADKTRISKFSLTYRLPQSGKSRP